MPRRLYSLNPVGLAALACLVSSCGSPGAAEEPGAPGLAAPSATTTPGVASEPASAKGEHAGAAGSASGEHAGATPKEASSAATAPTSAEAPTPPPTSSEAPAFAPAPFAPPFEASAAPGDGRWTPLGDASLGELAAAEPPLMLRSRVHPHKHSKFIAMEVVAIDLARLRLGWVIGTKDHQGERLAQVQSAGLVPADEQARTVAVLNGGFQARHGWWGQMSHGITVIEPKDSGCTVALFRDGHVELGPWTELSERRDQLHAFRQTPPCLVDAGQVHPRLESGNTKVWAGTNPDLKTRRRSAMGISQDGRTLYFAIGSETGPLELARGMQAVGAHRALQLDINWAWTRFLLVGRMEGQTRVTSSLVEGSLHAKSEYFGLPSQRDFFYLALRD